MIGRRATGPTRSLINATDLQFECTRILHEILLVPVLMYGNETMLGRRRIDLDLGLYRWTTSKVCLVLERWIES